MTSGKKRETAKLGFQPEQDTAERFGRWVANEGYVGGKALNAALELFQLTPLTVRQLAMRRQFAEVRKWFAQAEKAIVYMETQEALASARQAGAPPAGQGREGGTSLEA